MLYVIQVLDKDTVPAGSTFMAIVLLIPEWTVACLLCDRFNQLTCIVHVPYSTFPLYKYCHLP